MKPHRCRLRSAGWLALLLLTAGLSGGCRRPGATAPSDELADAWAHRIERPNIVLILVDTLRRDRLGCYGHHRDTSPNLDRLAASSILYENAFSQASWTLPSTAALLTSRFPSELGIEGFQKRIPASAIFLQQVLSAQGYSTHAIVSHDFLGAKWGFNRGFDSFVSFASGHRAISSPQVTDAALAVVDRFGTTPVFLFVHYFDPHYLWIEHQEHRFSGTPPEEETEWWSITFRTLQNRAQRGHLSDAHREHLLALYDSEIAFTDRHIGRLLDRLESQGHLQRSIVIFTADHGEEFLDHGGLGHNGSLYNELIHVPLLIRWPGTDRPVRSQRYVAHVDLLPTLLDYLDIPLPHQVVGIPLRQRSSSQPIFSETRRRAWATAVIQDQVKLIHDHRTDRLAFFDLRSDPDETQPLARPPTGATLVDTLRAFEERSGSTGPPSEDGAEIALGEEELDRLRALGYID